VCAQKGFSKRVQVSLFFPLGCIGGGGVCGHVCAYQGSKRIGPRVRTKRGWMGGIVCMQCRPAVRLVALMGLVHLSACASFHESVWAPRHSAIRPVFWERLHRSWCTLQCLQPSIQWPSLDALCCQPGPLKMSLLPSAIGCSGTDKSFLWTLTIPATGCGERHAFCQDLRPSTHSTFPSDTRPLTLNELCLHPMHSVCSQCTPLCLNALRCLPSACHHA